MLTLATTLDRLGEVVRAVREHRAVETWRTVPLAEPTRVEEAMARILPGRVVVTGTLERRLLLAELAGESDWVVAELSGHPLNTRAWPAWTRNRIGLHDEREWISSATITADGVRRLLHPRVLLVALYHPEWFPLPRFPLAISDLARAARATLTGSVRLIDMQLGVTMSDIEAAVLAERPDVVGVSATFGQHDLTVHLLDFLHGLDEMPLVLAGGSLTARNEQQLLHRYPRLLVARGAGEPTMQDVLGYWHGDLNLDQVRGIGYIGAPRGDATLCIGRVRRTPSVANRAQTDFLPELDLLDATFAHGGVAQLEISRGCTNTCSFCPRGHKGTWAGTVPDALPVILDAMREVFDQHPGVSRTLYLVDEEFIGGDPHAAERALTVADLVHGAGFGWESSCRIDQIVTDDGDRSWHLRRADLFRQLCRRGLRRMLFGVESGVDTILARFHKETTGGQNALAIRTLSALGVPTRYTYITFDPLMTADELRATYQFQGRTDLLLRPQPQMSVAEIVDGVRDERFVAAHTTGVPLYTGISYLLVSMECLIGAAYTRQVTAAGLAGPVRPAMGRVDSSYADWRIGRCSHHAQLWIDRHFPLDYTLKSLEKVLDGAARHTVRAARVILKDAAYALLGQMIDILDHYPPDSVRTDSFDADLAGVLDTGMAGLRQRMRTTVDEVLPVLPASAAQTLSRQYQQWNHGSGWRLINTADPCGT